MKKSYYHIYSAATDSLSVSRETAAELQKSWLCKSCNAPKPNIENVDVTIQESTLGKGPMNIVWGAGVGVARRDFLSEFGDARIKKNFWLGRLFTETHDEVKDWATYRGKQVLIIRGRTNVDYRVCDECGQFLYYAAGRRYLYPSPPSNTDIFESHLQGLIIGSEVFKRLALFRWVKLNIEKLPVASNAYDRITIPPQKES